MQNITINGAVHTMFANGAIRDASAQVIGFYDRESGALDIDGHMAAFQAHDEAHAMELIERHYVPRPR